MARRPQSRNPVRLRTVVLAALSACLLSAAGQAQLPVDLPDTGRLPVRDLTDRLRDRLDEPVDAIEDARQQTLDRLLRANRDRLERSPAGDIILRRQITALRIAAPLPETVIDAGFGIVRRRPLVGLGGELIVLEVPLGLSTAGALRLARSLDPAGTYDFNHVYSGSGRQPGGMPGAGQGGYVRLGLVDTGVDTAHPAFRGVDFLVRGFVEERYVPAAHGTAVADIASAPAEAGPAPLIYSADIYGGEATGGALDALVDALSWMAREEVGVINVSLVGPDNLLLREVVATLQARGHIVIAAVGNDGPAAPPRFPAAYDGVVGVTGLGRRNRILPEACRGPHVDVAAPGLLADVAVPGGATGPVRGTSFAAPLVAARLARFHPTPDAERAAAVLAALMSGLRDAGVRGRDPVYGAGILDAGAAIPVAAASER